MGRFRFLLGYFVAVWYVITGKRRRLLAYYDAPGTCLAIVGHDPKAKDLELLLKWYLRRGFTFIVPSMIDSGLPTNRRLAWLSFDDGWISFKTDVLPVLEKLDIPATLFIAPHETEQGQLWTNGTRLYLGMAKIKEMYALPWNERQKIVDDVFAKHGNLRRLMTKQDVIDISRHPLVDVQNHTMTHLSCCHRPVEEVMEEIKMAQVTLKEWIGKECKLVCYPFCHHTEETDSAVKAAGLVPVCGDAGEGTIERIGATRNMFKDHASLQENIGRSLNAWKRVKIPT